MAEAAQLLQILVAIWIVELLAALIICLWAALFEPREPHDVFRIPDYYDPNDWTGGDRTQTKPERQTR